MNIDWALARSTEDRYRRWLIAYPRRWRQVNADALLGTWLDAAQAEGRERPTGGEIADLLVHGLAERVRPILPSAEVHRKAARLALIIGTAAVLAALVLGELLPPYQPRPGFLAGVPHRMGALSTTGPVLYLPWLVAVMAAVSGAARAARALLAASSVIALALIPGSAAFDLNRPPVSFLVVLAWLAALAATSPAEPAPSHRVPIAVETVLLSGWLVISGVPSVTGVRPPARPH